MKKYIEHYRESGYKGLIQVVKLKVKNESWLYNSKNTILEDLAEHNYSDLYFISINHYIDNDQMLDITELQFCDKKTAIDVGILCLNNGEKRIVPYYKEIREYIGNNTLFSTGMSLLVENDDNEFAIGRRSDNEKWDFPAVSKELKESIIETVNTEIMEEFGIEVNELHLIGII